MTDHAGTPAASTGSLWLGAIIAALLFGLAAIVSAGSGVTLHGFMHWLGVGLLVTGILLAAQGISDVRREWTKKPGWRGMLAAEFRERRDQGARRFWIAWNALVDRCWIARIGLRPHRQHVTMAGSVAMVGMRAQASAVVTRQPPPSDGTLEERLAWLETHMTTAYEQVDVLRKAIDEESKDRAAAIERAQSDSKGDTRAIRDDLANLAGGGLTLQTWGVMCLLAGTMLTAFYP